MSYSYLFDNTLHLLCDLIRTPSLSGQEENTAAILYNWLQQSGASPQQSGNNVWAVNKHFDPQRPTLMLVSHHDTVKPNAGYTRNPFDPIIENGILYGLGSNDAGGCLAAMAAAFVHYNNRSDMSYNLLYAAVAEEENSGHAGLSALLPLLPAFDCALVGEPTTLEMAVAEKGLLVLDCLVHGRSGHAARNEGENALYKAIDDIQWFRNHRFSRVSDTLGEVKMTVTIINSGSQHNVVPDRCAFTVDVRVTDAYTLQQLLDEIKQHVTCEVRPRSMRGKASGIDLLHPLVVAGKKLGIKTFGSSTASDWALLNCPAVKIGPGQSARSHTPDEFLLLSELQDGINTYINLISHIGA